MGKLFQQSFDYFQQWLCGLGTHACMDGHGGYVWLSYFITFTVLTLSFWIPVRAHKLWLLAEAQRIKRQSHYEENS